MTAPPPETLLRQGVAHRMSGDCPAALRAFDKALRSRSRPRRMATEIHAHKAYAWFLLGRHRLMRRCLARALSCQADPRSAWNVHLVAGTAHFSRQRFVEAAREYALAEQSARDARGRAYAIGNRALALLRLGDVDLAVRLFERARRIHERRGDVLELARNQVQRAALAFDRGQKLRAAGLLRRAAKTFRALGAAGEEARALQDVGYVALERGDLEEAGAALDRAIRLAKWLDRGDIRALALACRADLLTRLERHGEASRSLRQAERLAKGRHDPVARMYLARVAWRMAMRFGFPDAARRAARRGEAAAVQAFDGIRAAEFRAMRAAAAGRPESRPERRRSCDGPDLEGSLRIARRLARVRVPVLVVCDDAEARMSVVRNLHGSGPLLRVDCARLVRPLADLYGHARGAWSGADRVSLGAVRRAQGGTLVLDGVDELAPGDQRALIPLLDGRFRPVGSVKERFVRARVVATCRSPSCLEDVLRRRLAGAVLRVAPLAERRGEMVLEVLRLLRRRRRIRPEAMGALAAWNWRCGRAELEATIERLVCFSRRLIGLRLVRRILSGPQSRRSAGPTRMGDARRMAESGP